MTTKETLESSTAQPRKNNGTAPVVLITGALTGIGRATALAFAHEGARVVVSGRHDDEGQKLVAELGKLGAEAEFLRSDVRHEDDVRGLVDQTVARFGRLDVAVNNAGTEGKPGLVTEQSTESYAATFDTNVLGTLLSIKHELRVMLAQGHGSIINVSSTFGRMGAPGASVYVASKHAVEGLTKAAALEAAGSGVRVNVIAPGPIETGMLNRFTGTDERKAGLVAGVPLKRVGRPEEIAQTIVFVASDKASYITGASSPSTAANWLNNSAEKIQIHEHPYGTRRLNPTPASEHAFPPWRLRPPASHSRQRPRHPRREKRRI
jgi:NAD(P)-dependent dehydrogenase (short-subunit alcohol dehydrogenase family)